MGSSSLRGSNSTTQNQSSTSFHSGEQHLFPNNEKPKSIGWKSDTSTKGAPHLSKSSKYGFTQHSCDIQCFMFNRKGHYNFEFPNKRIMIVCDNGKYSSDFFLST